MHRWWQMLSLPQRPPPLAGRNVHVQRQGLNLPQSHPQSTPQYAIPTAWLIAVGIESCFVLGSSNTISSALLDHFCSGCTQEMARGKTDQHGSPTIGQNPDSDPNYLHSWRLFAVTLSICLSAVLYGLDMNIIGVAAPVITTEFHSLEDVSWYSASYLLTITAFQPCFGNVYKYFSVKAVFAGSIVLFESE